MKEDTHGKGQDQEATQTAQGSREHLIRAQKRQAKYYNQSHEPVEFRQARAGMAIDEEPTTERPKATATIRRTFHGRGKNKTRKMACILAKVNMI